MSFGLLRVACLAASVILSTGTLQAGAATSARTSDPWSKQLSVTRGLAVVLDDTGGELALRLARETELLLYVQLPSTPDVEVTRRAVEAAGLYGSRIFVEQGPRDRLHLANNLADALLAVGEAASMSETEALRVLRPEAVALLGSKRVVKPIPSGLDDWSHPYHGPDNNPLSRDQIARGPYLTHFLADPRYAPLPQVAVASGGRVFKAFGHIAFKKREEPWLNTLAAFSGYNGTLLWRREISPALMVHRNTLVATPTNVFFGDDKSCKVYDAATGEPRGEIIPPADVTDGTFWKWMALENGVLYAVVGEQEQRDPVIKANMQGHGWPWDPLSPGFNTAEHTWGFGRTLLAIDPATKKVLWNRRENQAIDSRAVCMKNGRIYAFRFDDYLSCIDAKTGKEIWRKTKKDTAEVFYVLGDYSKRQDWRTNWRTTAYLKCSDQALYFAGPQVDKLVAVSAEDGHVLWSHPYNNYQLVLRDDAIYGMPGQIDKDPTRIFDPLTGKVLQEINLGRRACTRVTGSIDALFCRANGGSTRFDVTTKRGGLVSPMRPNCHDGVTIANGLLYWWPSVCDCNLTLYGITCLGPAGDFNFSQAAVESERLVTAPPGDGFPFAPATAADWPMFRANPSASVTTEARIPLKVHQLWETKPTGALTPTAPTTVGDQVFVAGSDGVVRGLSAASGALKWKAFTGGDVRYPPSIWQGRAFVGSGDGWVYSFETHTGRQLWRFRAAPVERRIPVYGSLQSTWPVGSGVLVADGVAYAAAGIVNYDGTHVFALDAATGRIKWQNTTSGHLDEDAHNGVSVQGHMMVLGEKLFLPGGNALSPAIYDIRTGKCQNDPKALRQTVNNNVPGSFSPRGNELYRIGTSVMVAGKPHYAHPQYPVLDAQVLNKTLLSQAGDKAIAWLNNARLLCFAQSPEVEEKILAAWGKPRVQDLKPIWEQSCKDSLALAVAVNAAVVAMPDTVAAYALEDGKPLWSHPLPAPPVPWGLAVNRDGRVILTLEGGRVICLGASETASAR